MKFAILLAILFSNLAALYGQPKTAAPEWDLSYKSVLERNNVAKGELIWAWLARYKSPVEKWISEWNGKPIISSIVIEYPAFHAGEHSTMWLIRTNDGAYYWYSVEGHEADQNEEPITLYAYDVIFKAVSSWQQLTPRATRNLREQEWPGYFGFLSHHGVNSSKQMLLTIDDFVLCLSTSCLPGKLKSGRLMAALEPILIPESRKSYRHKSEAQIARMTPEQRIDEQTREHENHSYDPSDRQSRLISRYRRKDGIKGVPYLIQRIESYLPKRIDQMGVHDAVMMVKELDERVVRMRSSPDGRKAIAAIEQLAARMRSLGKSENYSETDLRDLNGVNITDATIRDTLWVKYRLKMSDNELLEFSNFLVRLDPTYPGWSEGDLIKDYSRINEWGNPAQVYVMRAPRRYYDAYLKFKTQTGL